MTASFIAAGGRADLKAPAARSVAGMSAQGRRSSSLPERSC
jgi:hypothetical protein